MGGLNHLPAKPCIYSQTYPNIVDNDVHSVTIDDNSFPQLDGNVSVCTDESENNIPYLPKTDRAACALNLPSIAAYNVHSLFPILSNQNLNLFWILCD